MFGDNEMLLVQGTNWIVKLLVTHEICWGTCSNFEHCFQPNPTLPLSHLTPRCHLSLTPSYLFSPPLLHNFLPSPSLLESCRCEYISIISNTSMILFRPCVNRSNFPKMYISENSNLRSLGISSSFVFVLWK